MRATYKENKQMEKRQENTFLEHYAFATRSISSSLSSWRDWNNLKRTSHQMYSILDNLEKEVLKNSLRQAHIQFPYMNGDKVHLIVTNSQITDQQLLEEAIRLAREKVANPEYTQIQIDVYPYEPIWNSSKAQAWKHMTYIFDHDGNIMIDRIQYDSNANDSGFQSFREAVKQVIRH
jgi:hypothetical protein